ncbi:MAG: hypothetical protein M1118_09635 [Chloroflexi bacterium]|nr:hypothetical protein [Chloroflexota bacterium]
MVRSKRGDSRLARLLTLARRALAAGGLQAAGGGDWTEPHRVDQRSESPARERQRRLPEREGDRGGGATAAQPGVQALRFPEGNSAQAVIARLLTARQRHGYQQRAHA